MGAFKHVITSVSGILVVILLGSFGFHFFEGIKVFDALWMTVITLLTVGYGDMVPVTEKGRIFALIIIPIGIGLVTYGLGAVAAITIEGELSKTFGRKRMERKINKLDQHIIICGVGRVGKQVMRQLQQENTALVLVDVEIGKITDIDSDRDILYVEGDATDDSVLYSAGIERASGLIAALPEDADNVFITLTAKGLNPKIQVVARAEKLGAEEKLYRAGADKVINPSSIAGRRMAMSILKPVSVDYVDTILHDQQEEFGVEEIVIQKEARLVNKTLIESAIREKYGVTIVAIKRKDTIISNPTPEEKFQAGDIVIVFGTKGQLTKYEIASKS